jgi:hypothetical protein
MILLRPKLSNKPSYTWNLLNLDHYKWICVIKFSLDIIILSKHFKNLLQSLVEIIYMSINLLIEIFINAPKFLRLQKRKLEPLSVLNNKWEMDRRLEEVQEERNFLKKFLNTKKILLNFIRNVSLKLKRMHI